MTLCKKAMGLVWSLEHVIISNDGSTSLYDTFMALSSSSHGFVMEMGILGTYHLVNIG